MDRWIVLPRIYKVPSCSKDILSANSDTGSESFNHETDGPSVPKKNLIKCCYFLCEQDRAIEET